MRPELELRSMSVIPVPAQAHRRIWAQIASPQRPAQIRAARPGCAWVGVAWFMPQPD